MKTRYPEYDKQLGLLDKRFKLVEDKIGLLLRVMLIGAVLREFQDPQLKY